MKKILIAIMLMGAMTTANAWDGYTEDGEYIDVESYDHRGQGEGDVEYYKDGEYHYGYLDMYVGGTGTITDEDGNTFEVYMD